ncbi:MAG: MFS transporter [Hormoscilla sp. GUM202]|nr:MFS transporter [Hormoscilla sp. GUM202]
MSVKEKPWLPQLPVEVWILAVGRVLTEIGNGLVIFYAPILFVNQVGLSATAVGIGIGSGSIAGVIGRFIGGSFADSPLVGRRGTLLLSAVISGSADLVFANTHNLPIFILGNLLSSLGIGLYWPAREAVVADVTTDEQRNEAFAVMRLVDSIGSGLGVMLGGLLLSINVDYRILFAIDGISFGIFFGVVYIALGETGEFAEYDSNRGLQSWLTVLADRPLMVFLAVNILFTAYHSLLHSAMPLYLSNFVQAGGLSAGNIGILFTWHMVFGALCQLPLTRWLNRFSHPNALKISMLLWGVGFGLIWVTGVAQMGVLVWAILALSIMGAAVSAYIPAAAAYIVDVAPASMMGVYFAMYSQCWAIGYFIGPSLGGWALDRSRYIADGFWLAAAVSVGLGILILQYIQGQLQKN